MIGLYPFLKYYYKAAFPKKNGRCFHIIGLDILVDNKLTPWILEANANPSLNIDHEVYKSTGETITEVSEIDRYVKRMVIEDAIFLMRKPPASLQAMEEGEQYFSYKKILNADNEHLADMNIFEDMLKIFHHLTGIKTKRVITASQFGKLSRFAGMTNERITKNDYHLIFIKIMRTSFNPTQMDFEGLIHALEYIVKEIHGYTVDTKYAVLRDQVTRIVSEI
ncbi:MAG: hypothetical protein JST59_02075 [Actinobacteria bacterium]|nr:hypothetical protein [Actinomycetota bacterium]